MQPRKFSPRLPLLLNIFPKWGFPKTRAYNEDYRSFGSILGSPYLGKLPSMSPPYLDHRIGILTGGGWEKVLNLLPDYEVAFRQTAWSSVGFKGMDLRFRV